MNLELRVSIYTSNVHQVFFLNALWNICIKTIFMTYSLLILYFQAIQALAAPHVESFNFFLEDGLRAVTADLSPVEFSTKNGQRISLMVTVSNLTS